MDSEEYFNGVVCCSLNDKQSVKDVIGDVLDTNCEVSRRGLRCLRLNLANKYYTTDLHLLDYNTLVQQDKKSCHFDECHAIIFYVDGQKVTTEQLDTKLNELSQVGGEPRILLCSGLTDECESYRAVQDWCVKNTFDFYGDLQDRALRTDIINSLSAYKWPHRLDLNTNRINGDDKTKAQDVGFDDRKLSDELMENLNKFDTLLTKIRQYKEKPELRGSPNDPNIQEIAEILSGLLSEDVDQFNIDEEETD